jgi:hypothetical protein
MTKDPTNAVKDVLGFVDAYVDSFISWDILIFFHHNSSAIENAGSLSGRLGRRLEDTKDGLTFLCDKGVLHTEDNETYEFKPEDQLAKQITAFSDALTQPDTRLRILSKVLSKGKVR